MIDSAIYEALSEIADYNPETDSKLAPGPVGDDPASGGDTKAATDDHVPDTEDAYRFDHDTTLAILAGFAHNRRVMLQGYHGTGQATHIEQVAARLNWPCVRVNLDSGRPG